MMMTRIFRKVALARISSPDQLDQTIRVVSPMGWVALVATGTLLAAAVTWSIVSYVPEQVTGRGILISSSGIYSVESPGTGSVRNVFVRGGDPISRGQVLARISQPQILSELNVAREKLANLSENRDRLAAFNRQDITASLAAIEQERLSVQRNIDVQRERASGLRENVNRLEGLQREGIVTFNDLMAARQALSIAETEAANQANRLRTLELNKLQLTGSKEEQTTAILQQIDETRRAIDRLQTELVNRSEVVSQITGVVLEVNVQQGDFVAVGTPVANIEPVGADVKSIQAAVYLSAADGKKIRRGMRSQISPSSIKNEEYGHMLGIVTDVSAFPASRQAMMRTLANESLVSLLSANGAPFEVRVDLIPDPRTPSGYRWSSSNGPPQTIGTGTLCTGSITVQEQRPISLAIPFLRKTVLGVGEETRRAWE